jgi:hypothetical protein
MTNKMPVVGQRYRHKKTNSLYRLAFGLGYSDYVAVNEQDSKNTFFYSDAPSSIKLFWENFEELPTSNLQENEEVQDISICFRCGKKGGIDSEHKCNRFAGLGGGGGETITPNPVDLEKGEISEIERASEWLKKVLDKSMGLDMKKKPVVSLEGAAQSLLAALEAEKTKGTTESENKYFQAGWIAARTMFRKANDETKEAMKLLQFQVDNHCKEYINEVDPRFLPPLFIRTLERAKNLLEALSEQFTNNDMSKPEPKIDMKEERVEPVSIWKDVSESIYHCNFSPDQLCLYEKFIESFKQIQKDIQKLMRK